MSPFRYTSLLRHGAVSLILVLMDSAGCQLKDSMASMSSHYSLCLGAAHMLLIVIPERNMRALPGQLRPAGINYKWQWNMHIAYAPLDVMCQTGVTHVYYSAGLPPLQSQTLLPAGCSSLGPCCLRVLVASVRAFVSTWLGRSSSWATSCGYQ